MRYIPKYSRERIKKRNKHLQINVYSKNVPNIIRQLNSHRKHQQLDLEKLEVH